MVGREIVSKIEGMKKFSVELEILPFRDLKIFKHGSLKFVAVKNIPLSEKHFSDGGLEQKKLPTSSMIVCKRRWRHKLVHL